MSDKSKIQQTSSDSKKVPENKLTCHNGDIWDFTDRDGVIRIYDSKQNLKRELDCWEYSLDEQIRRVTAYITQGNKPTARACEQFYLLEKAAGDLERPRNIHIDGVLKIMKKVTTDLKAHGRELERLSATLGDMCATRKTLNYAGDKEEERKAVTDFHTTLKAWSKEACVATGHRMMIYGNAEPGLLKYTHHGRNVLKEYTASIKAHDHELKRLSATFKTIDATHKTLKYDGDEKEALQAVTDFHTTQKAWLMEFCNAKRQMDDLSGKVNTFFENTKSQYAAKSQADRIWNKLQATTATDTPKTLAVSEAFMNFSTEALAAEFLAAEALGAKLHANACAFAQAEGEAVAFFREQEFDLEYYATRTISECWYGYQDFYTNHLVFDQPRFLCESNGHVACVLGRGYEVCVWDTDTWKSTRVMKPIIRTIVPADDGGFTISMDDNRHQMITLGGAFTKNYPGTEADTETMWGAKRVKGDDDGVIRIYDSKGKLERELDCWELFLDEQWKRLRLMITRMSRRLRSGRDKVKLLLGKIEVEAYSSTEEKVHDPDVSDAIARVQLPVITLEAHKDKLQTMSVTLAVMCDTRKTLNYAGDTEEERQAVTDFHTAHTAWAREMELEMTMVSRLTWTARDFCPGADFFSAHNFDLDAYAKIISNGADSFAVCSVERVGCVEFVCESKGHIACVFRHGREVCVWDTDTWESTRVMSKVIVEFIEPAISGGFAVFADGGSVEKYGKRYNMTRLTTSGTFEPM